MKQVLMVAFHFPPLAGGSGIQRSLRFLQHLPTLGWQPLVLTANARAYSDVGTDLMAEIPAGTVVQRSFALDTARHLSILGKYPGWMARPDRWASWKWAAVRDGLRLIKSYRPKVIWSTYPIATAHQIGAELHRQSGLPWIADFRDPMAQEGYPSDPQVWQSFKRIEERAMRTAACCVFTTQGAARTYRLTYPDAAARIHVVENGYDEESFATLKSSPDKLAPGKLTLLHSGIVYPSERDPSQLFAALASLFNTGSLRRESLCFRFRAPVHGALLNDLALRHGLRDVIEVCPPLPYREALREMMQADGLLLMQAANCNAQVPAKLYEYLRAGRPIIGLTDLTGDTAAVLRAAGIEALAALDNAIDIATVLQRFIQNLIAGHARFPTNEAVALASRQARSRQLAELLNSVAQRHKPSS